MVRNRSKHILRSQKVERVPRASPYHIGIASRVLGTVSTANSAVEAYLSAQTSRMTSIAARCFRIRPDSVSIFHFILLNSIFGVYGIIYLTRSIRACQSSNAHNNIERTLAHGRMSQLQQFRWMTTKSLPQPMPSAR
jgi:hypothetical protein